MQCLRIVEIYRNLSNLWIKPKKSLKRFLINKLKQQNFIAKSKMRKYNPSKTKLKFYKNCKILYSKKKINFKKS